MDYKAIFGLNLKRLTKEAKVTYKEVGTAVNRKSGTVQQWVSGLSQPDYDILVALAEFFTQKLGRYILIDNFFRRDAGMRNK
jgi:transcriptional regulator with XRE-family HTH domain